MKSAFLLLFSLMMFASIGCSTFPRDYRNSVAQPRPASTIDGPWQGSWKSATGNSGSLKCLLVTTPSETSVECQAHFEANFWGLFTAHYAVPLYGTRQADVTHLSGDQDLGGLEGGKYHYEATVTPDRFDATYRSPADHGEFHMTRPAGAGGLPLRRLEEGQQIGQLLR